MPKCQHNAHGGGCRDHFQAGQRSFLDNSLRGGSCRSSLHSKAFKLSCACVLRCVSCVCVPVCHSGQGGTTILSNFKEVLAASEADRTAQGLHSRFALTEFMARTSGDYSQITANPDQAADATKFASQAINLATAGADLASIYAFKFSVTLSGGNGVAKNGIHWGDNVAAPFNIADTTLAAEAYRLVAEHLSGAKSTYVLTSTATWTGVTDTKAIAVRDGNAYYVYIVNKSGLSSAILAQIKLAGLGIGAGVPVFVDSVNAASYGEVSEQLTTDATGSVSLVSVPLAADGLPVLLCSSRQP